MDGTQVTTKTARSRRLRREDRKRRAVYLRVDEFNEAVGDRSVREIARLLDCGESTISNIRSGEIAVGIDVLVAMARTFGPEAMLRMCDFGLDAVAA